MKERNDEEVRSGSRSPEGSFVVVAVAVYLFGGCGVEHVGRENNERKMRRIFFGGIEERTWGKLREIVSFCVDF